MSEPAAIAFLAGGIAGVVLFVVFLIYDIVYKK